METIFWISTAIVLYTYLGYPIVLTLISHLRKNRNQFTAWEEKDLPSVTLVIPAFNEADLIEEKIENSLNLNYPKGKLEILIVADGSTDNTVTIVERHASVRLLFEPERMGKSAAINRSMNFVSSDIVIFNDANTQLGENTILDLVQPFTDPQVAGASGEKQITVRDADGTNAQGEGLYWKYESYLKRKDAEVWSVMGAAGELIAFRTHLVKPLEEDTILDDFMLSLRLVEDGYRIAYVPKAKALETASASVQDELSRKVRIAAGGWQSMLRLKSLLRIENQPLVSFMYISHRVLRWSVSALALPIILLTNILLAQEDYVYATLLVIQTSLYICALIGLKNQEEPNQPKVFMVPFYFVLMNYSVWAGFLRFLKKSQPATWERVQRAV